MANLRRQSPRRLCAIHRFQFRSQRFQLFDAACYADPVRVLRISASFPIHPEVRIFQALNEEVAPLIAVGTPGLDGERLVLVVLVAGLLVAVFDEGGDCFRRCEGPHDEGAEEVELDTHIVS